MQKRRHLTGMHAEFMPPILTEREQDIKMLRPYLTSGLMGIKRLREHIYKLGGQSQVDSMMADLDKLMAERPLAVGFKRIYEIVEDFILEENPPQVILRINLLDEMKRETTFEAYIAYQVKHFFRPPPREYCTSTGPLTFTHNPAMCTSNVYPSVTVPAGNRAHRRSKK